MAQTMCKRVSALQIGGYGGPVSAYSDFQIVAGWTRVSALLVVALTKGACLLGCLQAVYRLFNPLLGSRAYDHGMHEGGPTLSRRVTHHPCSNAGFVGWL